MNIMRFVIILFAISMSLYYIGIADDNDRNVDTTNNTYEALSDESNYLTITGEIDMISPCNEMRLEMKESNYSLPSLEDLGTVVL
ncbi:MAG: hypothetical protein RBT65_05035 [Methanolobus sp.]|nr:hypothetical protein [Methanolobus sp.]